MNAPLYDDKKPGSICSPGLTLLQKVIVAIWKVGVALVRIYETEPTFADATNVAGLSGHSGQAGIARAIGVHRGGIRRTDCRRSCIESWQATSEDSEAFCHRAHPRIARRRAVAFGGTRHNSGALAKVKHPEEAATDHFDTLNCNRYVFAFVGVASALPYRTLTASLSPSLSPSEIINEGALVVSCNLCGRWQRRFYPTNTRVLGNRLVRRSHCCLQNHDNGVPTIGSEDKVLCARLTSLDMFDNAGGIATPDPASCLSACPSMFGTI